MKEKYLKPTAEDVLMDSSELMIKVSIDDDIKVENGGNTSDNNIIEGDSRRSIWDDED